MRLFIACAPGLEPLLADEVRALGADPRPVAGGVEVDGELDLAYRLNLELGLALKVLVRLGHFEARRFPQLVSRAAELPWEAWCAPDRPLEFRVVARRSRLYHSGAIAERLRAAIERRIGAPTPAPGPDATAAVTVHARLERDQCTVSVDLSGEPLHRRGYRLATGKAPLREDLARALIKMSGWRPESPLLDPFAGAGTIPIEAALLASARAPGANRRFAFMDAPSFDAALWRRLLARSEARRRAIDPARFVASDRDAGAVRMASDNAARAGFDLCFVRAALGEAPWVTAPPAHAGALVSNPPYGQRVGRGDGLRSLYQSLGQRVRALPGPWRVALAVAAPRLAMSTGISLTSALMTDHGGSKIYFMVTDPGSNAPE